MDVIKLVNKALRDEDIGTVLGANAKISRSFGAQAYIYDLDDLLTKKIGYCIII